MTVHIRPITLDRSASVVAARETVKAAIAEYGPDSIHVARDLPKALTVAWSESEEATQAAISYDAQQRGALPEDPARSRQHLREEALQAAAAWLTVADLTTDPGTHTPPWHGHTFPKESR